MKKSIKAKKATGNLISEYQAKMVDNAQEVLASKICGCPHCGITFPTAEITDWAEGTNGSMTALCPHCGFADVVAEKSGLDISDEALGRIGKAMFPNDRSPVTRNYKINFLSLYDDGMLNESPRNEAIFLQYSSDFAAQGSPYAATRIGMLYEFGSRFTKIDYKAAFSYYASDSLAGDGFALARLGRCLEKMPDRQNNLEDAFKCYAHSSALGNDYGKMYLGDCFLNGVGVQPNRQAASGIYMSLFHSVYKMFIDSKGNNPHILPELCLRIMRLLTQDENDRGYLFMALRYALIGQYAITFKRKDALFQNYVLDEMDAEFRSVLDRVGNELGAVPDAPYFDVDCFLDTFDAYGNEGYLDQGPGRISIHEVEGKSDSYDIELKMASGTIFVVDTQALYCGFHAGVTHWLIDGVESISSKKRKNFDFYNVSSSSRGDLVFESIDPGARPLTVILKENGDSSDDPNPGKRKGEA